MSLEKTPVTVVTGFLGAGKTTLIRHLLQNPQGRRLAVLVNEFGDVGVDGDLIRAGDSLRRQLFVNIARLRDGLAGLPWRLLPSATAIQPLVVGENDAAVALAEALWERGLWVPAIRPPVSATRNRSIFWTMSLTERARTSRGCSLMMR